MIQILLIVSIVLSIVCLGMFYYIHTYINRDKPLVISSDYAEDYKRKFFSYGKGVYKLLFLKPNTFITRKSKKIPIRLEFHEQILRLKKALGKDFHLYMYVDNVLEHHFDTFKEEIEDTISGVKNEDECLY